MSRIEPAGRTPEDEFVAQYNSTRETHLSPFEETRLRSLLVKYKSVVVKPVKRNNRPTQQEMSFRRKFSFPMNATESEKANHIMTIVSDYLSIERQQLPKKGRQELYVYARRICMHFIYITTSMSLKGVGKIFNRDHTTVLHSNQEYYNRLQKDSKYQEDYELFKKYLLNGKRSPFPVRAEQG
jgi:hypothetical protein